VLFHSNFRKRHIVSSRKFCKYLNSEDTETCLCINIAITRDEVEKKSYHHSWNITLHRSRSISHGFSRTMARGRGSSRYGFHGSRLSTDRLRSRYIAPAKKRSLRRIDDPPDVIPSRKARIASIRRSQKKRRGQTCPSSSFNSFSRFAGVCIIILHSSLRKC